LPAIIAGNRVDTLVTPHGIWPATLQPRSAPTLGLPLPADAVAIDERIAPEPGEHVIVKKHASAFFGTNLANMLRAAGVDTVIVTGCTTSGCVRATTVDSFSNGFRTIVPEDCVGDQGRDAHESNLRDVHRRYAEVTNSQEVVAYLGTLRQPAYA